MNKIKNNRSTRLGTNTLTVFIIYWVTCITEGSTTSIDCSNFYVIIVQFGFCLINDGGLELLQIANVPGYIWQQTHNKQIKSLEPFISKSLQYELQRYCGPQTI